MSRQLWLLRHGATEWALNGRHTGSTDLPLLPDGEAEARALKPILGQQHSQRCSAPPFNGPDEPASWLALATRCRSATTLLSYGDYEGITTTTIRQTVPNWTVWSHGCPGGEDAEQVEGRCARAICTALDAPGPGDIALFAHGHILRALAGTWLGLGAAGGQLLPLATASVSILGWEREIRAIRRWNAPTNPKP